MVHLDKGTLLPICTRAISNAEHRSASRSRINRALLLMPASLRVAGQVSSHLGVSFWFRQGSGGLETGWGWPLQSWHYAGQSSLERLTNCYHILPQRLCIKYLVVQGFRGDSGKESTCQCRRCKRRRFNPWVRKIPWKRKWQPAPVFLPRELYGQRSLVGPWVVRVRHDWAHMHLIVGESYRENYTISIPAHLGYFGPRLLQYYYFFKAAKLFF